MRRTCKCGEFPSFNFLAAPIEVFRIRFAFPVMLQLCVFQRCVQQCERSPRARCTATHLYMICVTSGTSTSHARRALTLLSASGKVRGKFYYM